MRLLAAALTVAGALAITGGASATESTIVPGVGIGKLKLGMTLRQAERIMGKNYIVNSEGLVDGARYRDLAWNYASWEAVFLRRGFDWRVIQIETTINHDKTVQGVGVSSSFKSVISGHPGVFCSGIYTSWGSHATDSSDTSLIIAKKSIYTAFAVKPSVYGERNSVWRVYAVIVAQAIPGHQTLTPYPCAPGWRTHYKP
jgi:hypothetical protein